MKEELNYALYKMNNALSRLKEGTFAAKDELTKDGVIQRFEFTFELFWKTVKIFLRDTGVEAKTPKESLKEAFKIGWIEEEETFLNMLEDKNKTSHIYDQETSEEIFERIKDIYVGAIESVVAKIKSENKIL